MARKNSNAGQPNRAAQIDRRAHRVQVNKAYRRPYKDLRVLGPLSENLSPQPRKRDLETKVVYVVQEKVSA